MRSFEVVVAMEEERGIGLAGALPWRLPGDMAFFKRVTSSAAAGKHNAVVMGRKTYESIPAKFRPLPGRLNVVLSRSPHADQEGVLFRGSFEAALSELSARADVDRVFVIGGGELYAQTLAHPACEGVHLTRVHAAFTCDTFLAPFEERFRLANRDGPHTDDGISYTFEHYSSLAHEGRSA